MENAEIHSDMHSFIYDTGRQKPQLDLAPVEVGFELRRMTGFRYRWWRPEDTPYQRKPFEQKPMRGNELLLCAHRGLKQKGNCLIRDTSDGTSWSCKGRQELCVPTTQRRCLLTQATVGCSETYLKEITHSPRLPEISIIHCVIGDPPMAIPSASFGPLGSLDLEEGRE